MFRDLKNNMDLRGDMWTILKKKNPVEELKYED